jgi:hypothetical protein
MSEPSGSSRNTLQIPSSSSQQQQQQHNNNNNNNNKNNEDMPPPSVTIEVPKLEVDNKKEKTMAEFLAMMDNYAPIV